MKCNNRVDCEMVKCIDGIRRSYKRCIGFCNNNIHRGFITKELIPKHKCLERKCIFFDAIEDHPYILKHQKQEQLKNIKKQNKKNAKKIVEFAEKMLPEGVEVIFCKHLYASTFILILHSSAFYNSCELFKGIHSELNFQVYIKNISEKQIKAIEYTYMSLLPENMRQMAMKYNGLRK